MAVKTVTLKATEKVAFQNCPAYRDLAAALAEEARFQSFADAARAKADAAVTACNEVQRQLLRDRGEVVADTDPVSTVEEEKEVTKEAVVNGVKQTIKVMEKTGNLLTTFGRP